MSMQAARELAAGLNPRADCGEPAYFYLKRKPEGGRRPITSFGLRRRALQKLAVLIVQAIWGPLRFDYAQRGWGRTRAVEEFMALATKKGGPRWFVTADIENCFGSFNREGLLATIPLPRSVIEHCILVSDTMEVIHTEAFEPAVRHGLPQGSLASSYIAGKLIEMSIGQIDDAPVLSFADDILVGAPSEAHAKAIEQNLHELFGVHPAGPLLLKSRVAHLGQPINFLGYQLRRRKRRFGGGVYVTPSRKAFDRFELRFVDRVARVTFEEEAAESDAYRDAWVSAFPVWERVPNQLFMVDTNIGAHYLSGARALRKSLMLSGKHPSQQPS